MFSDSDEDSLAKSIWLCHWFFLQVYNNKSNVPYVTKEFANIAISRSETSTNIYCAAIRQAFTNLRAD